MEPQWIIEANGQSFGPFTTDQLVKLAQSGQVQPFHMVRRDGGPLVACAEVKGLFDAPSYSVLNQAAPALPLPPTVPLPAQPAMTPGYYTAPSAPAYGGQAYSGTAGAARHVAAPSAVPATPAASTTNTGRRKRGKSGSQMPFTIAAIVVGAAAAVVIYINLEPLEKRIRGSGNVEEEVAVSPPPASAARAAPASPAAANAGKQNNSPNRPTPSSGDPAGKASADDAAGALAGNSPSVNDRVSVNSRPGRGSAITAPPADATPPVARVFPGQRVVVNGGPVALALNPAQAGNTSSWLQTLDSIYARRDSLVDTRRLAQEGLKPLLPQAAKLELDYKVFEPDLRLRQADFEENERRIAQLTASTANDPANSLARNNLAVRIEDRTYLRARVTFIEDKYNVAKAEFDRVKKQIDDYTAQLATVVKDADTLRKDFLNHLDPFGPPSKERGAEGVRYFTDKISVERDSSFAYLGRASAYLLQGENKLAIADLDSAVKAATVDKSMFLTVRGVANARAGDLAQARKDLSEAVRIDDKNTWCKIQYCLVLCRTEAFTIIEQQLRECMKLEPSNPEAFVMMALLKSTADDKFRNADYALRLAQTAHGFSASKSWDTALALAAAHAEKGDFDQAVEFAQKAAAAAGERQAAWCGDCLKTFQAKKPLRIDWKTFDLQAMK